jgi:hypothetical protein
LDIFNTNDGAGEMEVALPASKIIDDEDCDSCKI